jgi:hypothetical protein
MLGENAVGYVLGAPQNTQLADGTVVPAGTAAVVEMEREPSFDRTRIVGNLYVGANITEQERGCLIRLMVFGGVEGRGFLMDFLNPLTLYCLLI